MPSRIFLTLLPRGLEHLLDFHADVKEGVVPVGRKPDAASRPQDVRGNAQAFPLCGFLTEACLREHRRNLGEHVLGRAHVEDEPAVSLIVLATQFLLDLRKDDRLAGAADPRDLVHGLRGALVHEIFKNYVRLLSVDVRVLGILAERRRERILHGPLFIVFIFLYNSL